MRTTVGRTYRFRATHSLPGFPEPWCFPHQHDYTVEMIAAGGTDTLALDEWWDSVDDPTDTRGTLSTVENVANMLLSSAPATVQAVVVWEDRQRWGKAER